MQAEVIKRHSSRRSPLSGFLPEALTGATGYDRIAGYFSSSLFQVAGEAISNMAEGSVVRIICNSDLSPEDVTTARAAQAGMLKEWKHWLGQHITPEVQTSLQQLYDLLESGRLKVRVLPSEVHGLLHGKAGVIRYENGERLSFVGSANETLSGWQRNYEIVWSDRSPEGCSWVQAEFDALWNHSDAHPLASAVVTEIKRVARRTVISNIERWRGNEAADAQAIIEAPIYQREGGLWAHQKWFIQHAFELHRRHGARLVLADQVGLGKTIQLALAAKLMLLWGNGNVLAVVPQPLMKQWRGELWEYLRLPSALWDGQYWIDEQEIKHAPRRAGHLGLLECPRRFGIISSGLVKRSPEVRALLTDVNWECVILDEAHHARRKNFGVNKRHQDAQPNNLLQFLSAVGSQTRSMLLATATPIQLDPIEAYDLLDALNKGNLRVIGANPYNQWRRDPRAGLDIIAGKVAPPKELADVWQWMCDPFPDDNHVDVAGDPARQRLRDSIRRLADPVELRLGRPLKAAQYSTDAYLQLRPADRGLLQRLADVYFDELNPYIAHIVRRRREFLEDQIDPSTNEPFLPKVKVRLYGDQSGQAINLTQELRTAYDSAEGFCEAVGERDGFNSGFLETLLLRRVGSTIYAGERTAKKLLGLAQSETVDDEDEVEELDDEAENADVKSEPSRAQSKLQPLMPQEREHLEAFLLQLGLASNDPKYDRVLELLRVGFRSLEGVQETEPWLELGCIIFSQYFDSAKWLADRLTREFPDQDIALYAGSGKSGLYRNGMFESKPRDLLKELVRDGRIKLVIGTDAASEGLNLQRLGTLINLDLPWNPTRLEQRKGRIQRIGQVRDEVYIYNMRYKGSVEDKVHDRLSTRTRQIMDIFGQLPDTLEAVWVEIARNNEQEAARRIDQLPEERPFIDKYDRIPENLDWETCSTVLDSQVQMNALMRSWDGKEV